MDPLQHPFELDGDAAKELAGLVASSTAASDGEHGQGEDGRKTVHRAG
ncbi:hypothetical protein [Streptomyces sp. NBC_00145]